MTGKRIWIAGAVVLGTIGAGAGAAYSVVGDDENSTPITGEALQRASEAALTHTGGGRVTETEVGDEESRYEVEVTADDGSAVDVQLDESFRVVGSKSDTEDASGESD